MTTFIMMIFFLVTLEVITKADSTPPSALKTDRDLQSQTPPSTFPPLVRDSTTTVSTFPPLLHDRYKDEGPVNPPAATDRPTSPIQDHATPISPVKKPSRPSQLDGVKDHVTTSTFPPLIHEHIPSSNVDKYKPMESPVHTAGSIQQPMSGACSTAIIGCCSPISPLRKSVMECLNLLGCSGPFWGLGPCSSTALDEAFRTAAQFYKNSKL